MAEIHHLRPTAEIAPTALLPGDPGRALAVAQELLDRPLMANHARGLWGYSGVTAAGAGLTIQSTGLGGPSLAIVVTELARLGLRSAVRLGTCRAVRDDLAPGDPVIVGTAIPGDGASRELGADATLMPDPELTEGLSEDGARPVLAVASTDLHYHPAPQSVLVNAEHSDVSAVDLASATLLTLGPRLGLRVAAALVVVEAVGGGRADDELIAETSLELARSAARALHAA